jgi:hypothetical protein
MLMVVSFQKSFLPTTSGLDGFLTVLFLEHVVKDYVRDTVTIPSQRCHDHNGFEKTSCTPDPEGNVARFPNEVSIKS